LTGDGSSGSPARKEYGPNQLADFLGAFRGQVSRARTFGLLPEPDRRGGRCWSAALAEQIRSRWPEIVTETECVGAAGLRERGWTEAMIRDLLGKPDLCVDNPHYKSAGPMRLWRVRAVEAAEAEPGFAERRERAARQRASAARAAQTRDVFRALGGYAQR